MHLSKMLALAAPLAGLVSGLNFSSPAVNGTLDRGNTFNLTWKHVDTDPKTFSIYLVNFVNWPPFYTPVAFGVDTFSDHVQVRVPCAISTSYGFQFNAINGTNTYIIYAQTPKFSTAGGDCVDPEPIVPPGCPTHSASMDVAAPFLKSRRKTKAKRGAVIGWGPGGYDSPVFVDDVHS